MPEPPPLGDPVDSDPTPSQPPHHNSVGRSEGTHTRTLTVSQDKPKDRKFKVMITTNDGGLGPVAHSFPPS